MKKFIGDLNFSVHAKTGYYASTAVVIYGADRKPFYAAKAGAQFNLPKGIYGIDGFVNVLPAPIDYELPFYPVERDDRKYSEVIVKVTPNKNKASVIFAFDKANIFLDPSIVKLGMCCFCYAVEHELAHALYIKSDTDTDTHDDVENRCDTYAEHRLIERGFNPSQCKAANQTLLKSGWRKSECNNRMHEHFSK